MLPPMPVAVRALFVSCLVLGAGAAEPVTRAPQPASTPAVSGPVGVAGATAATAPTSVRVPTAIPPSPSTVPGVRIWPAPVFTHWPAIVYPDEERNVAFALPVRTPGASGSIGWEGSQPLPFTPADGP